MPDGIPNDSRTSLHVALLLFRLQQVLRIRPSINIDDRGRNGLKKLDGRLLRLRKLGAGRDGSGRCCREPPGNQIWLRDKETCQHKGTNDRYLLKPRRHGFASAWKWWA